jgi:hypothetical protein
MAQLRKMVYGDQGTNHELYKLYYNELDTVKVIKVGRLTWLGHLSECRSRTLAGS